MRDRTKGDWYIQEWAAERGKIQASLVTELGWHKTAAHRLWHGRQPYRRDQVAQVAEWLGIEPFELLMAPDEAAKLRRLRELLTEESQRFAAPAPPTRTGTGG